MQQLDQEAALRGISRQALIKTWLYERLELRALNVQRLSENVWSEGMARYYVERPRGSGRITELIESTPLETKKDKVEEEMNVIDELSECLALQNEIAIVLPTLKVVERR